MIIRIIVVVVVDEGLSYPVIHVLPLLPPVQHYQSTNTK